MNRKTLGVLAIAIVVVMFAVVVVGDSGLSQRTEALAQNELNLLERDAGQFERLGEQIRGALQQEPALFGAGGYDETWAAAIEAGRAELARAERAGEELRAALEADEKEQEPAARQLIQRVNAARVAALAEVEPAAAEARRLLAFKEELPERLEAMAADFRAIEVADLGPITATVNRARADWPGKDEDLAERLGVITEIRDSAQRRWEAGAGLREAAAADAVGPEQLVELARDAEAIRGARRDLDEAPGQLADLVDQLYWSWDKILADMAVEEGYEVVFKHEHKVVRTPVQRAARTMAGGAGVTLTSFQPDAPEVTDPAAAGVEVERDWVTVSKGEYERMKRHLGMVIEHKDAGKYDHEAEDMVQPAGYQYIAPYGERNRYGYWRGGFWVWYGQYAFMRDMFWGPRWRVGRGDWEDYRRHRSSGRTYFGTDDAGRARYGSNGTATRTNYAGSRYVQTGGFRNSRYERSGGSYRGSRYVTRSSRSGGYSRSGSRFGGK